jgi:hypothetical protein
MDPLVTNVLQILVGAAAAIIAVVAPVVAAYIVSLLKKKIGEVEAGIPAKQLDFAKKVAAEAVKYAEVLGANTFIADKEAEAVKYATDYLAKNGITLDVAALEGLIKSAFLTEINGSAPLETIKAPDAGASMTPPVAQG